MSMPGNMDTMYRNNAGGGGTPRAYLSAIAPYLLLLYAMALMAACSAGPEADPRAKSEATEDTMNSSSTTTTVELKPAIAPIDAQAPAVLERASFGLG
jgi:hypothetical protein